MADGQRPPKLRSCDACRAAHAKCDSQLPTCARCLLLKSDCIRGLPLPFRYSNSIEETSGEISSNGTNQEAKAEFEFPDNQIWVSTQGNVEFIFEYLSVLASPATTDDTSAPLTTAPSLRGSSPVHHLSPEGTTWLSGSTSNDSQVPRGSPGTASSVFSPRLHLWPLQDEHEARLLQYFVTDLASWFDYCDPFSTFATAVAQLAASSAPLRNAIFATSARHLSIKSGGHGLDLADQYHRKCLELLIPMLDNTDAALDEGLYAATVILRLYEEISGQDMENHLMGTHTFVRAQEYDQSSRIRQAVFRVVLRQEIVIAFRTQRPVQLLPEYIQADRSLDQSDDWTLAFHIIVLCAEILTYCYGDDPKTIQSWDELMDRAQKWMDSVPISFQPLLHRSPCQGQIFPTLILLNDCHVAARQHYLMCQILLLAHDPRKPQLGPRRVQSIEVANSTIRDHVRNLCGITLSNTQCIPSMFTACIAIAICGDLFTENQEQTAMLGILVRTDVELAWPTASIQAHLQRQWGWDCDV